MPFDVHGQVGGGTFGPVISSEGGGLSTGEPHVPYPSPWVPGPGQVVRGSDPAQASPRINGAVPQADGGPIALAFGQGRLQAKLLWSRLDGGGGTFMLGGCAGRIEEFTSLLLKGNALPAGWARSTHLGEPTQTVGVTTGIDAACPPPILTRFPLLAYEILSVPTDNTIDFDPAQDLAWNGKWKWCYDPRNASTVWTRNAALVILELIRNGVDGGRIPDSAIDLDSFSAAADVCDEDVDGFPRWALDVVLTTKTSLRAALDALKFACAAQIYRLHGKIRIDMDGPNAGDPEIAFNTALNCREFRRFWNPASSSPTKVIVRFKNAAVGNADDKGESVQDGVDAGTVPLRLTEVTSDAISTKPQAQRAASYVRKVALPIRGSLICSPVGALLHKLQKVSVVAAEKGETLNEWLVEDFEPLDGGEYQVDLRLYDEDTYVPDEAGDQQGGDPDPNPLGVVPPVVRPVCTDAFDVTWQPARNYKDVELFPPGYFTQANVDDWDDTLVNDGDTGTIGGTFVPAADSEILLTFPASKRIGGMRLTLVAGTAASANWIVEADGTPVVNGYLRENDHDALNADPGYWREWDLVDATTLKLRKGTAVAGTEAITELQYREFLGNYPSSDHVLVLDRATGAELTRASASTGGPVTKNLALYAGLDLTVTPPMRTLDVDLVNVNAKGTRSIPVRVVHSVTAVSLDEVPKPRMLRVNPATGKAEWQRPCLYLPSTLYGGSYWSATNYSTFTASGINDGDTTTTAWNPNAAGVSDLTLDLTGEGKIFNAALVTFASSQAIIGKIDQFKMQLRVAGVWYDVVSYLATIGTSVTYSGAHPQVSTFGVADAYAPAATSVRFEWDHRDVPGVPDGWRLLQLTSAAINMPVTQVQFQEFDRWNLVSGFEIWAGLNGITNGAGAGFGKHNEPMWVSAGGPGDYDYEFTSANFDAGPYVGSVISTDRRRPHYPTAQFLDTNSDPDPSAGPPFSAPVDVSNTLGHLFEVTVRAIGLGPESTPGQSRFAWDYAVSVQGGWQL